MGASDTNIINLIIGGVIGFTSAIFAEPLRRCIYRPQLKVEFGEGPEYKARTPETATIVDTRRSAVPFQSFHDAEYIRIRVTNVGRSLAKQCRAYLIGVEKRGDSEDFEATVYSDSIPLAWSCREGQEYDLLDLPKEVVHFVDVVSTRSISEEMKPAIRSTPYRYNALFKQHGEYRFSVQISGSNVKPVIIRIIFSWFGIWDQCKSRIDDA